MWIVALSIGFCVGAWIGHIIGGYRRFSKGYNAGIKAGKEIGFVNAMIKSQEETGSPLPIRKPKSFDQRMSEELASKQP